MGVFETILAESSRKPGGLSRVIERRAVKRDPMLRTSTTGPSDPNRPCNHSPKCPETRLVTTNIR